MDARSSHLQLDELDPRIAPVNFRPSFPLSGTDPGAIATFFATTVTAAATAPATPHRGNATGDYSMLAATATGTQTQIELSGSAKLAGVGHFDVSGTLHSAGDARGSKAGGHLTLTDGRGTVVLHLVNETRHGEVIPGKYTYTVVGGTGAFHYLAGHGTAHLVLTANGDSGGSYTIHFT